MSAATVTPVWPMVDPDLDTPTTEFEVVTGDLNDYVGRHRLREPEPEFLDTFPEAAAEHTADLAAIAAPPTWRRVARWITRNLTGTRVTVIATTASLFSATGLGWWLS